LALRAPRHREVSNDPEVSRGEIIAHYQLVAPIMEQLFGRIPIVWTTPSFDGAQDDNKAQQPIYHAKFFGHYSHLTSEHVQHLASIGAQEFHSWFPLSTIRRARGLRASCWNGSGMMQLQLPRTTSEPARRSYTICL
jgi:hypothetical protein